MTFDELSRTRGHVKRKADHALADLAEGPDLDGT